MSSEDEDTRSRFPEVLGQYVFDGQLSFSDLSVVGKPVYVRRVGSHQYALHFNAQYESWWIGDFVGDSTPLLKQVTGRHKCPADTGHQETSWGSQHHLVNDDSQTFTSRWVVDTTLVIGCW